MVAAVSLLGGLVVGGVTSTPAFAAPPRVSAALNTYGYPTWYEDNNGVRLEPCLDTQDTLHCVILPTPGVFNSQQPLAFPSNFPDEFFYNVVDADKIATPGCPTVLDPLNPASQPGFAFVRLAVEGAFANGLPAIGDQMTFGRVRIVVRGGLCPGQQYTFVHPYGTTTLTANADGGIKPVEGTVDIGCVPVAPQTCNFAQALGSPIMNGFLRWDPAVLPLADPGYLGGDAAVLHPIVGSPVNTNVFTVQDGAGTVLSSTTLFTVSGKVAGPLVSSTSTLDLGGQVVDVGHGDGTVTITNVGADPLLVNGAGAFVVGGADAAEFTVTGTSCGGGNQTPLARDESCTVNVRFAPVTPVVGSATGPRTASLAVAHNGIRSPLSIALRGTSISPGQEPDLAVSTGNGGGNPQLAFGSVRIGTQSASQPVTITNIGSAPLQVTNLQFVNVTTGAPQSFDSQDAAAFRITQDTCSGIFVPAQGTNTCQVQVGFAPIHTHDYVAALRITANTSGGPREALLLATGIGGVAAVSTGPDGFGPGGIDPSNGFPTWYQDEAGVRLGQCLDPNDPNCIVLPDANYSGGATVGLPSFANFPSEFFYFVSDSDIINTPGCGSSPAGKAFIRMADEGAFANDVVDGDQMVFGRIRIVVTSGLCPNTPYVFTHPFGQVTLTADAAGGIRRNAATQDIGCFPIPGDPCNFAAALASPVLGGFLRQVNPPAGYIGDPNVFTPIEGAPFLDPETPGLPANLFRIRDVPPAPGVVGALIGETTSFAVMGKLVGPMMADPSSLNFGSVEVGSSSPEQTVTYSNDGQAPITVGAMSVAGTHAGDYAITNNNCTGRTLQPVSVNPSDTCDVRVRFTPVGNGTRLANLVMAHTGRNNPLKVALSGIGGAPVGEAAISVNPPAASFVDLHVATPADTPLDNHVSAPESIKVSNTGGTAPLKIGSVDVGAGRPDPSITGPGAANFTLVNHCTAPVAPNAECVIDVAFSPVVPGELSAFLDIPNNVGAVGNLVQVALNGRGFAGAPAASANTVPSGFPAWFQDDNGVRVEPCLYQGDPNCVLLPDAGYNAANPLVFPTNFPTEFFYSLVDSNLLTIPADPSCGGGGGTAQTRIAVEGSFATGTPLAGQQITFSRIRFNASGLCPNTTYDFIHPYGTSQLTSNGTGVVKSTVDVPNVVGSSLLTKGMLRWDPNASPAAPAGYLGDGRTFHTITGSRYRQAPGGDPVNFFRVRGGAINETMKDFVVSGRLAGPVVVDATSRSFAPQVVGTQSATQNVTLTNLGPVVVGNLTAVLSGPDAGDFAVVPTGSCQSPVPAALSLDQTCAFAVRFSPALASVPGVKSATLTVSHDGLRSPITVSLGGTATPGGSPEIHLTPATLAFGNQNVNVASAPQVVTIQNTGTADLVVTGVAINGTGSVNFGHNSVCGTVAPAQFCTFQVVFNPLTTGNKTATLSVLSNDNIRGTVTVALSGTGVAPVMTLSPTSLSFQTKGTATKTINVTNTGTAVLNLVGAPAIAVINQVPASNPLKFTATNNCNNVAPGGKCTINVTFAPGAGPNNETITATLRITSNAINSPQTVALSGQRK